MNGSSRGTATSGAGSGGGTGGGSGGPAATNGVTKIPEKKKFSLGQYKDRKLAGKMPSKTNPPAVVVATGTGSKNSPITTGDKKSVHLFSFLFYGQGCRRDCRI